MLNRVRVPVEMHVFHISSIITLKQELHVCQMQFVVAVFGSLTYHCNLLRQQCSLTYHCILLSLAPTRRFFPASGLCLSLPIISCVGLRQVKQRNELSHLAFLMRSIASLLRKDKHVYALL